MESTLKLASELSYAQGTAEVPLLAECIGEVLRETARKYPDQDALVVRHQRRRYSYRQLDSEVDLVARGLLSLGIRKGDRVGIWATNCAEWVLVQFGAARMGAILVNINPANRLLELEYVLRQSQCQTLVLGKGFHDADYVQIVQQLCPELPGSQPGGLNSPRVPDLRTTVLLAEKAPSGFLAWSGLLQQGGSVPPDHLRERESQLKSDDPINIQYTSGTTGFPKGATLSHRNIVNNALLVTYAMRMTHQDRLCIPVPFYHCFGMVMANMGCVVRGAAMVVPAERFDAEASLRAVAEERCTAIYGVPTMFIAELEHPGFERFDLTSLRTGIMAGSPCPLEVMKRVVHQMHCREMTIAYGLTEASPVITQTLADDPLERRVSTVGRVLPHTEAKIVDPATGEIVPRGTQGELCTRGYCVMKGYYNDQKATRAAIDEDGWLHSGDLAIMDADGYFRITGRAKDMIIRGGENIYPREIEEFLYTCPGVSDAQVVGVPDRKYGELVVAWVKAAQDAQLDGDGIRAFLAGKIAHYKIPERIKIVDAFPLTATGKIQKFKIREIVMQEMEREAAANAAAAAAAAAKPPSL